MKIEKLGATIALLLSLLLLAVGCGSPAPQPAQETNPEAAQEEQSSGTTGEATAEESAAEEPATSEPKILRTRLIVDPRDMDPAFETGATEASISRGILEGLVEYKPGTYEVVNALAETIEVSEDGLVIDFKLREGVQFHKGYGELTAEDVKYSYERYLDPELDATYKDDWQALDHVEVTGKYTGRIHLKEPYAPLWTTTLPYAAGRIISKAAMEEMGRDAFKLAPVGTGPYEFVEHVPEQKVILKRFADYWGEAPDWDEIHYMVIVENLAAEIALETGEVDFAEIDLSAVERFQEDPNFGVLVMPALRYHWIGLNDQNPKLADPNIRQAIRYGIDVDQILEVAFEGQVERARGIIPPGMLGHWEDAPLYERDVEKAKESLAAAGLESLDLTMAIADVSRDRAIAEIVQANLAEVGINVEIVTYASGAFVEAMQGDADFAQELHYSSFTGLHDPAWSTMWFLCEQVQIWNYLQWCNEEFDALHYEAIQTTDPEERHAKYIEMQEIWDEAANVIWLTHGSLAWAYRTDKLAEVAVFPGTRITLAHTFQAK